MMRPLIPLICAVALAGLAAAPAFADSKGAPCDLRGLVPTDRGAPCSSERATPAPQPQLLGGIFSGAVNGILSKLVSWVNEGASGALRFTASLMNTSTTPALQSTWFSATYWRVAGLSTLLTLPFLFAAAAHALVRSDLALLGRAAFGYLPLAMLAVAIAAPLTALVVSATDEMCGFVAAAGGHADVSFLSRAASAITAASVVEANPFLAFFAGVLTVAAVLALWLELLVRDAAVDVIVLMLPLFFAAMVWPARRMWAIRAIETLFALILSKFAIVAVLTLGGSALGTDPSAPAALLTGATLVLLAVVSPWALLRVLPLHEVAAAAAGGLSQGPRAALSSASRHIPVPGRPSGGGGGPHADGTGLGLDGDAVSALRRTVEALGPGAGAGRRRSGQGGLADLGFDPESTAGLAAVDGAGLGSVAPAGHAESLPSLFASRQGDRPPIGAPFGDEPWEGYEIGDTMQPPRIARREDPPGTSPAGSDAPRANPGTPPADSAVPPDDSRVPRADAGETPPAQAAPATPREPLGPDEPPTRRGPDPVTEPAAPGVEPSPVTDPSPVVDPPPEPPPAPGRGEAA